MPTLSYTIFFASVTLEVHLLYRLLVNHCWRRYLWVFLYVSYTLVIMDLVMFGFLLLRPDFYRHSYWQSETVSMGLRFFVIWEVFQRTFRGLPALFKCISRALAAIASIPIIFSLYTFFTFGSHEKLLYSYSTVERSCDFVQAFLMLGILVAVRYYRLRLGRNIWGIAVGIGAYVSISTAIFSLLTLKESLLPYMQIVSPLSFVGMLGMWTWALWIYAPNPGVSLVERQVTEEAGLSWWDAWNHTLASIKRTKNP